LKENMAQHQLDAIKEDPSVVAILICGASYYQLDRMKTISERIKEFVEKLDVGRPAGTTVGTETMTEPDPPASENVDIWMPEKAHEIVSPEERIFLAPWAMGMTGASAPLRTFILWKQTFAISPDLTFHVVEFNPITRPWVVVNLLNVRNEPNAEAEVRAALQKHLCQDVTFAALAQAGMAKAGSVARPEANIDHVLQTLDVRRVQYSSSDTLYQVTIEPVDHDPAFNAKWRSAIENPKTPYRIGVRTLETHRKTVDCGFCKNVTHPMIGCSYPLTEGWAGPTVEQINVIAKRYQKAYVARIQDDLPTKGKRGGRGGGRSSRGGRRGNMGASAGRGSPRP
jgi:hypothetical protein